MPRRQAYDILHLADSIQLRGTGYRHATCVSQLHANDGQLSSPLPAPQVRPPPRPARPTPALA